MIAVARHAPVTLARAALAAAALAACQGGDPAPAAQGKPTEATAAAGRATPDPWATRPSELPPPEVTDPLPAPLFFAARKGGTTTYLFGTLHGGVAAGKRIPRAVWARFDAAPVLVLEANVHDLEIGRWTIRAPGPTLREELGPTYFGELERRTSRLEASLLDRQATAVAAVRIAGIGGAVVDLATPMDGELLQRAKNARKRVAFLETPAFQSAMFAELYTADTLRRALDRADDLAPLNARFAGAYVAGDAGALEELAAAQFTILAGGRDRLPALWDRLLTARNAAWLPAIEEVHARGDAFVAVGALHLVGEGSVPALLAARGFEVSRVAPPP